MRSQIEIAQRETPAAAPVPWQVYLLGFAGGLVLWMLLAGSIQPPELAAGALVSLAAVVVFRRNLVLLDGIRLVPAAPLSLLRYLAAFLVALLRANLDMARRVLSPSLPLNPAIVQVRTSLRSPLGRLMLANSITLTPGTLTVDVEDDVLHIHWIDTGAADDLEARSAAIAADFERHLQGFLK